MSVQVDILLATFNGDAYLSAQLDSILLQTYPHWHLYIRDDGSSDKTTDIIAHYTGQYPDKITYLGSGHNGRGAKGNFSLLMEAATSSYIAFSDQDDIWMTDKIAVSLSALRELENNQPEIPCMIFTDLSLINADGKELAISLWKHESINPRHTALSRLLVQNVPYGCASIINRSLLLLATPVEDRAMLHDHWIALLAAASGRVGYIQQPTIYHRIHTHNASRAANPIQREREISLKAIAGGKNFKNYFSLLQMQAAAVLGRINERGIGAKANDCNQRVLMDFVHIQENYWWKRKILMIRNRYFKQSWQQTIKWIVRL